MAPPRGEVLQGTLDLIVLKTLDALGPLHGYGIAQRIQQVSQDLLKLNQGTLYPALLRLEQRGWISSKWGVSDNNRKAKYYSLTRTGRRQLLAETESWLHYDLPSDIASRMWSGRWRGQRQKWFLMRFTGEDADIDPATEHPEFDAWEWVEPRRLPDLIVPFKRPLYCDVLSEFREHLPSIG